MLAENVDFLSYLIYSLSWQLFICFGISHFYFICGKTLLSSNPAGSYHVKKTLLSLLLCFLGLHSVFFSLLNMCAGCIHLKCTAHMCTFDISHQFPEESSRWCVNWCYLFRKKWIDQFYVWTCPSATDKSDMTNLFACIRFYIFWYWQASKRLYNKVHKFLKDDTFV